MQVQLSDAARLYAGEWEVLEQARKELNDTLDECWDAIWAEVEPQLVEMQDYPESRIEHWKSNQKPGSHFLGTNRKLPVNLGLEYHDIRNARVTGEARVQIYGSQASRKAIRNTPGMQEYLVGLWKENGLDAPDLENSILLRQSLKVDLTDMDAACSWLSDAVVLQFQLITDLERWLVAKGEDNSG